MSYLEEARKELRRSQERDARNTALTVAKLEQQIKNADGDTSELEKRRQAAEKKLAEIEAEIVPLDPEPESESEPLSVKDELLAVIESNREKLTAVNELIAEEKVTAEEVAAVFGVSVPEPESSGEKQIETEAKSVTTPAR